jgi:hypothetical protein
LLESFMAPTKLPDRASRSCPTTTLPLITISRSISINKVLSSVRGGEPLAKKTAAHPAFFFHKGFFCICPFCSLLGTKRAGVAVCRTCVRPVRVSMEGVMHDFRNLHRGFHPDLHSNVVIVSELREHPPDGFCTRRPPLPLFRFSAWHVLR